MQTKPFGGKSYGSIGHLPASRLGPGDHKIEEGQARILTEKARDRHDLIIVQEKLDGSNVGIGKVGGIIVPVSRAGWRAETSLRASGWRELYQTPGRSWSVPSRPRVDSHPLGPKTLWEITDEAQAG